MLEALFAIVALTVLLAGAIVIFRLNLVVETQRASVEALSNLLEEKHRAVLHDLHTGLHRQSEALNNGFVEQGDRLRDSLAESADRLRDGVGQAFDRLRDSVSRELKDTRQGLEQLRSAQTESLQASQIAQSGSLQALQLTQTQALSDTREAMSKQLAEISATVQQKQDLLRGEVLETVGRLLNEQGNTQQDMLLSTLQRTTEQLIQTISLLTQSVERRLDALSGRVDERLDEGFRKTNQTFADVMARLATIDEAQKKIDGLSRNVVSLHELLGDKRARGTLGEVQLEHLVRNVLPADSYEMQALLSNGYRADCLLMLPEPTGRVAVDAKLPLDNYHRMFSSQLGEPERLQAKRAFKLDVERHIELVAEQCLVPGETGDSAVLFVPAEAVFAEIHAYHPELVQRAMARRVWIVSPTTMMAVLNTARAVIRDVETRRQVEIIQEALGRLSREFLRFDQRMKKLADHIRLAHEDALQVQTTSDKISRRFSEIEQVRLGGEAPQALAALEA